MSKGTFTDFEDALRAFESGVDAGRFASGQITEAQIRGWVGEANWAGYEAGALSWRDLQYTSTNSLGFVGYQFGEALLVDLGYYRADTFYGNGASSNAWTGTFTGKGGIASLADLKSDRQEGVILDAFGYNLKVIETGLAASGKSLDSLIGQTRSYLDPSTGQTVSVALSLTGILAAAHLRGAWGTLDLLQRGAVSSDEYGTSILKYVDMFGGYDAVDPALLVAAHEANGTKALAEQLWHTDLGGEPGVEPSTPAQPTGPVAPVPSADGHVTEIAWSWDSHQAIAFDPAHDRLDFGWFQAGQFTIGEVDGSTVVTIPTNEQAYVLTGVTLAELTLANVIARDASAKAAWTSALAGHADVPAPGGGTPTTDTPPPAPPVVDPVPASAHTVAIAWAYGAHQTLAFDPATDRLDFGWFQAAQFTITEENGSVVIAIPSNQQTYTLAGVTLAELGAVNVLAKDASAQAAWTSALGQDPITSPRDPPIVVTNPPPVDPVDPSPMDGNSGDHSGHGSSDGSGHTYGLSLTGHDITGFDAARDKLDAGLYSVHNFIVVDTPDGVGFRSPWSSDVQIIEGVRLADLDVGDFAPIGNQHLREDVSGPLAWEHGIVAAPHTVYARSHEVGQVDRVTFDPAADIVDFRYFGTRELVFMRQGQEGVEIGNDATGQKLILLGAKIGDMSGANFVFHPTQVLEDHLDTQLGVSFMAANVKPQDVPLAGGGTQNVPMVDETMSGGGHEDHSGHVPSVTDDGVATVTTIGWSWGSHVVMSFDPAKDTLDFGWMTKDGFALRDTANGVSIEVLGNDHSYLLAGIHPHDLTLADATFNDAGAKTAWHDFVPHTHAPDLM